MRVSTARQQLDSMKRKAFRGFSVLALACATLLLVTACGQTASAGPAPAAGQARPGSPDTTVAFVVTLTDANRFQPMSLTIPKGSTVTWKNSGQVPHTVTDDPAKAAKQGDALLPDGASPFDSGMLGGGQSYTHTFEVTGTYEYFCLPHEMLGMVGTITVTP